MNWKFWKRKKKKPKRKPIPDWVKGEAYWLKQYMETLDKYIKEKIMAKRIKPQDTGIEIRKITDANYELIHDGTILTDLCGSLFEDLFGPLFTLKNAGDRLLVGISHNKDSINLTTEKIVSFNYPVLLQSVTDDKKKTKGGLFLFKDAEHGLCVLPHENGKYKLNESDIFPNIEENKDRWIEISKEDLFKNL